MSRYERRRLSRDEQKRALGMALAAGAGVAAVTFYFGRILLARTPAVEDGAPALPSGRGARALPPRRG